MRIAAAAKQLGISTSTLKRIERAGLIQVQRDWNNDRRYTDSDIAAIRALYYPPATAPEPTTPDTANQPA